MLRAKPAVSMQKTYDEAFLSASTAVYFEGQNNEKEALRSWRSGLDLIYFHNAYKVPANYIPKTETERALQESLRTLELQCKERVDLLEALRKSRAEENSAPEGSSGQPNAAGSNSVAEKAKMVEANTTNTASAGQQVSGVIGSGTVRPVEQWELPKPPTLPQRPSYSARQGSGSLPLRPKAADGPSNSTRRLSPPPALPVPKVAARQSSPDPKRYNLMTTLRSKNKKASSKSSDRKADRPAASKAAGLAWGVPSSGPSAAATRSLAGPEPSRVSSAQSPRGPPTPVVSSGEPAVSDSSLSSINGTVSTEQLPTPSAATDGPSPSKGERPAVGYLAYRKEYPKAAPPVHIARAQQGKNILEPGPGQSKVPAANNSNRGSLDYDPSSSSHEEGRRSKRTNGTPRKSAPTRAPAPKIGRSSRVNDKPDSTRENPRSRPRHTAKEPEARQPRRNRRLSRSSASSSSLSDIDPADAIEVQHLSDWELKVEALILKPPKGVTTLAAKQIFNEVIVQGDEVHWDDVAGLDIAKKALKEAVVYPFLRPDLFMGLREPARGMLLFGPPGTGKTMLAKAVATESKSTFFAISASSLASKWHGESEQLVRALFGLAKALAPSIIFVDEIDSILSARSGSGSESETDRRTKTEFLIQWSDLQRAAAGRATDPKDKNQGDPSRVLVLAATNMPWDIDEAARRRFVRRQYIPLPESHVRELQLRNLLSHQKHELSAEDIEVLVQVTDGFSGSDITALAKDAAMGPLRSLGEALLHMSMDQIRPISFQDFEDSLVNIRPSVSKDGLREYEKWAQDFGERGG